MDISGTTPEPPPNQEQRTAIGDLPHEMAADRSAQLDIVADRGDLVEEGRDLAVVETLDGELDQGLGLGRRGDGIAALGR